MGIVERPGGLLAPLQLTVPAHVGWTGFGLGSRHQLGFLKMGLGFCLLHRKGGLRAIQLELDP